MKLLPFSSLKSKAQITYTSFGNKIPLKIIELGTNVLKFNRDVLESEAQGLVIDLFFYQIGHWKKCRLGQFRLKSSNLLEFVIDSRASEIDNLSRVLLLAKK